MVSAADVRETCGILELSDEKCKVLAKRLSKLCGVSEKPSAPRRLSKWQQCISERRKGKPFDPQTMKTLAKEYKAGRCPSG